MKKILCILLCMMLCISALCACTSNKTDTSEDPSDASIETPSVDISYDEVSYIIPGGNDTSVSEIDSSVSSESSATSSDNQPSESSSSELGETSDPSEQQTSGFLVKMAKYDYNNYMEKRHSFYNTGVYKDVSIAILDVINETDKNYSVTINGKYLDENGNVLKTETRTWDQFKAGWQKYFLFRPEITFSKFEYTLELEEYKGDCWKTKFSMVYTDISKRQRDMHPDSPSTAPVWVESLVAYENDTLTTGFPISVGMQYLVLFDAENQIIGVYVGGSTNNFDIYSQGRRAAFIPIYYPDMNIGKIEDWPDCFKGKLTGIIDITSVGEAYEVSIPQH